MNHKNKLQLAKIQLKGVSKQLVTVNEYSKNIKRFATEDELINTEIKTVYKIFLEWCTENNLPIPEVKVFGRAVHNIYNIKLYKKRINGIVCTIFIKKEDLT